MRRALATYAATTGGAAAAGTGSGAEADELVQRYAGLIDRVARRIVIRTGLHSALDDLWSAGAVGLLEAARRFDGARGVTFETFVEHRIRGAMLDELRRMDHLPRRLRSRTDDLQKARQKLQGQLGREASTEELAAELHLDMEEVGGIEALLQPHVPIDRLAGVADRSSTEGSAEEQLMQAQMVETLARGIERLPERLQTVLGLHYIEGLTYREIAKILDVSEPRVCQIHADGLRKLRAQMGDAGGSEAR